MLDGINIICNMGIKPTFNQGTIGINELYDHLPVVRAYFSINVANTKPIKIIAKNLIAFDLFLV